jgi:transcriptional regulator with XRE-family HTH domain
MDALHRRFARRVRHLMAKKGFSLNHMADFSGIGRGRLSEILAAKSSPTLRTVGKMADALGVGPADLLREDGEPPSR